MTDNDPLLTLAEVAERLRVPIATVRWWRANQKGPRTFKIGRHVVSRASDVDAYINQQRDRGAA
jgi:excisionase family DNA binding protein